LRNWLNSKSVSVIYYLSSFNQYNIDGNKIDWFDSKAGMDYRLIFEDVDSRKYILNIANILCGIKSPCSIKNTSDETSTLYSKMYKEIGGMKEMREKRGGASLHSHNTSVQNTSSEGSI